MNQVNLFRINKPIILVGIMGSGKTSIGTRLAKTLGASFFDTDNEIEASVGCSIDDIFKYAGEEFFRKKEKEVVTTIITTNPLSIVSTGGGTFIDPDIRKIIKQESISIWLKATYESLIERLSRGKSRPLLDKDNKEEVLQKLIAERYPVYCDADITIDCNNGPHNYIVNEILSLLSCMQK